MSQAEPPSSRSSSIPRLFRIGKDRRGNWVVQDLLGLCGGLFVDRAEALRFALFENGNRPQALIMVPGIFELDMRPKPKSRQYARSSATVARSRGPPEDAPLYPSTLQRSEPTRHARSIPPG
jgi:hypothetical protein